MSAGKQYLEHAPKVPFNFVCLGVYQFCFNYPDLLITLNRYKLFWRAPKGPSEPVCCLERHCVLEQFRIWFIGQKMVMIVVKLGAVISELLHGESLSATTCHCHTNSFSSGSMCFQKLFKNLPKTHSGDGICYVKQASEIMWKIFTNKK